MAKKIDFNKIRLEYITENKSVAQLARDYNVPYETLFYHYARENWRDARAEHNNLILRKTSSRIGKEAAKHYKTLYKAADNLVERINESIEQKEQSYKRVSEDGVEFETEQINTTFLREMASLLRDCVSLQNDLHGVLTEKDWQTIETDRMAIEKRNASEETVSDNTGGVIILPDRLEVEDG